MKKLKLNLDDLKVESFETTPELNNRQGTVFGFVPPQTEEETCDGCGGGGGDTGAECDTSPARCGIETAFTHCGQDSCEPSCFDYTSGEFCCP